MTQPPTPPSTTPPDPAVPVVDPSVADPTDPGTTPPSQPTPPAVDPRDETIRNLKSQLDKARATPAPPAPVPPTQPDVAAQVAAALAHDRQLTAAAARALTDYPQADPGLVDRAYEYASVEAFNAAVSDSHASFLARMEAMGMVPKAEMEAAVQVYVDRFGALESTTPTTPPGSATPGLPTKSQLRSMSVPELQAAVAKHGEDAIAQIANGI